MINSSAGDGDEIEGEIEEIEESFVTKKQEWNIKTILLIKRKQYYKNSLKPILRSKGACIDTRALKIFIQHKQALPYFSCIGITFKPIKSFTKFWFGHSNCKSFWTVPFSVPWVEKDVVCIEVDVVTANVPFLIGLDLLDEHLLYVNNMPKELRITGFNMKIPLTCKRGCIYMEWDRQIRYT